MYLPCCVYGDFTMQVADGLGKLTVLTAVYATTPAQYLLQL